MSTDPRALCAAEKHLEMVLKREGGPGQHSNVIVVEAYQTGWAARDAAGPPESPAEEDDTPPCLPGKKVGTFVGKFVPEPVSPAPPASPPPEGGFANKAVALPRLFVHEPWASQSPSASTFERPNGCKFCHEYLSVIECNATLAEAKQQGRVEALEECLRESERGRGVVRMPTVGHSAQSFGQDWAYTNIIVWLGDKLGRPTPSKGEK